MRRVAPVLVPMLLLAGCSAQPEGDPDPSNLIKTDALRHSNHQLYRYDDSAPYVTDGAAPYTPDASAPYKPDGPAPTR